MTEKVTRYIRQLATLTAARGGFRNNSTSTIGSRARPSQCQNSTRLRIAAGVSTRPSQSPSRNRGSALTASSSPARPNASSTAPTMSKRFSRPPNGAAGSPRKNNRLASATGARNQRATDQRPGRRADRVHQREDAERMAAARLGIKPGHQRRGAADDQAGP